MVVNDAEISGGTTKPEGSRDIRSLQNISHLLKGDTFLQWSQSMKLFIRGKGEDGLFDRLTKQLQQRLIQAICCGIQKTP